METKRKTGVDLIAEERRRQVEELGWDQEHDQAHTDQALALAATCYAAPPSFRGLTVSPLMCWPWNARSNPAMREQPTRAERIRELTKAGALIAAEIDRLAAVPSDPAAAPAAAPTAAPLPLSL